MLKIRAEKDFWTGLIYIGLGAAFLWFGLEYRMGTGARMGPGYFPVVLSIMLIVLGMISVARSFVTDGEPVGAIAVVPVLLVLVACLVFALLIKPLGLVIALAALCGVSFRASRYFHINGRVLLGLAALILFCVLVFVKGLGVPLPIFGSVFEPFLPSWLIR